MVRLAQVRRVPSKATKAEPETAPDNAGKRSDTPLDRLACAMTLLEAVTVKYETLAAGGTHGDLPGNGQETESAGSLYL